MVHVDDVLDAAPDMPRLKGSDVTVRLRDPKAFKVGAPHIFFTQPYSFGQTVAVDEIGSLPATARLELGSDEDLRRNAGLLNKVTIVEPHPDWLT